MRKKHTEKTERYSYLVAALKKYWGRVEFVAIPIGYAGTTLTRTLDHLTAAFSTIRPRAYHTNTNQGTPQSTTRSNAKSQDYHVFKSMMGALTNLAQSRLLGIVRNKMRLVETTTKGHLPSPSTLGRNPDAHKGSHPYKYDPHHASPGEQCHHLKWQCNHIVAHLHPGPHTSLR
jgi:hypothetical protein